MADTDPKVMKWVEGALGKDPKASLDDLLAGAKKLNPDVAKLSKRQFHARYPLQIKRQKAQTAGRRKAQRRSATKNTVRKKTPASESQRDAIRQVFLQFATDMAAADDRKDLVKVLAGVDRYVDQVAKVGR